MKKINIVIAVLSLSIIATSCSEDQKKSVARTSFMSTCTKGLASIDEKIAKEYCECSADIIFEKYSLAEIEAFGKQTQNGTANMEEFQKLIEPCLSELTKKTSATQEVTNPEK